MNNELFEGQKKAKKLLRISEVDQAQLVVIRGLPGSGKTTLAKQIAKLGFVHHETDHYFDSEHGYLHDESSLPEAHAWCIKAVSDSLLSGARVVVSNVSHLAYHVERFVELAERVVVIELTGNHGSVHDVPADRLEAMKLSWEPFPGAIHL